MSEDELIAELTLAYTKYHQADKAASISLPATSASGNPVIHRSRIHIRQIAEYWDQRWKLVANQMDYLTYRAVISELEQSNPTNTLIN